MVLGLKRMCAVYFYISALRGLLGCRKQVSWQLKEKPLSKLLAQHGSPCVPLATLNCH